MLDGNLLLLLVLGLILAAEFVNGWTDSPNAIATVVSTRVLSPYQALIMATVLNAIGAMSGTAVAATIGKDIVRPEIINLTAVAAAMVGIIVWSTLAWYWVYVAPQPTRIGSCDPMRRDISSVISCLSLSQL